MKARTIGPLLMITMGAAVMIAPAGSWVGAGDQDPCAITMFAPGDECDPCEIDQPTIGAVDPCIEIIDTTLAPDTTGVPESSPDTTSGDIGSGGGTLPETGTSNLGFVVVGGLLVAAGATLLVTGRRTPELS